MRVPITHVDSQTQRQHRLQYMAYYKIEKLQIIKQNWSGSCFCHGYIHNRLLVGFYYYRAYNCVPLTPLYVHKHRTTLEHVSVCLAGLRSDLELATISLSIVSHQKMLLKVMVVKVSEKKNRNIRFRNKKCCISKLNQ